VNIFLTGGTGFIGKKFLLLALKAGHSVYALSRQKQKIKHKNLKWLNGKLTYDWQKELKKSDILVHLASEGVNNKTISYKDAFKFNVSESLLLFKHAAKYNCKNWLISGSSSEYGLNCIGKKKLSIKTKALPKTNYEKTKNIFSLKISLLARNKKCKCRIMRIFPVYGDGENKKRLFPSLINAAKKGKDFHINNGNQIRDFTKVEFVSRIILDACNFDKKKFTSTQIWHISSGVPLSVKDFSIKVWKKFGATGKLIFTKTLKKNYHNYISAHKSIWKG
jgi:nucleoside-diphosphate-sugar epimerase